MREINKNINIPSLANSDGGDVSTPPTIPESGNPSTDSESSSNSTSSGNKVYRDDKDDYDYTTNDDVDMNNIKYITRNKKMSYFDNGVQSTASPEDTAKIVDKIQGSSTTEKSELPPGYYDYIQYDHRKAVHGFINGSKDEDSIDKIFRIGDCYFVIPPEFVTVSTVSSSDSIQALRQSGSMHIKHGYAQKEIQVKMVLNGMNQINGYEVESPFNYKYHVDGLRTLISQFKYTPFVPIENTLVNLIHGVNAVSLRNLTVQTIEGFPEALSLTISMQEFNTKCYTGVDECLFGDMIDWDLYRYYVQLPLKSDHKCYLSKITTPTLTNDFEIKLLKQDCLGGYKLDKNGDVVLDKEGEPVPIPKDDYIEDDITIDITNEIYYDDMITSKNNLKMTGMNFSMGNTMPSIQMSAHENPTTQYLGSTDTIFSFSFETLEKDVAAKFNDLNSKIQSLVLNNKEKSGIGFIKINNELVNLTCTNFLLINSIVVSTVPGFPDLHSISLECISYDSNQKENERLIVLNPFKDNRLGTEDDLITQETAGISNKIHQDAEIEKKLLEIEIYPDLHLPTYKDVNNAITKIRKFRTKNNLLEQMSISKLDKGKCEVTGKTELSEFGKYVDPDFYLMTTIYLADLGLIGGDTGKIDEVIKNRQVFTTLKLNKDGNFPINTSQFSSSTLLEILRGIGDNALGMFKVLKPKPDVVTEPDYAYGYEPTEQYRTSTSFLDNKTKTSKPSEDEHVEIPPSSAGGGINNSSVDPSSVKKKTGNPFVDLICDRADAKCGYVYGASGEIYSASMKSRMESTYGYAEYNGADETSQWFGKQVFDCSGLICWALRKVGIKGEGWRTSSGNFVSLGRSVSSGEIQAGDVFYNGSHAGLYIGDGKTVEAMNPRLGVAYGSVNKSKYAFVRIDGLKEACDKLINSNKSFYGNESTDSGRGTGSNHNSTIGTTVTVSAGIKKNNIMPRIPTVGTTAFDKSETSSTQSKGSPVLADFGGNNPCDKWNKEITKVAASYNFDPNFIKVIMMIESGGNASAISGYDPPNIVGLMQVYIVYHKDKFKGTNYFDPEDNIRVGCKIFADYGSVDWVNYDLEKLMCCYNAGPGNAQKVFLYGTMAMPTETTNYIAKYKKYYSQLVANGAKAGGTISPTSGGVGNITTGNGETDGSGSNSDDPQNTGWDWKYNYDETDFKNPNAGKKKNDKSYDINVELFGTSVLNLISEPNKKNYFSFSAKTLAKSMKNQNKENVVEFMYHDMVQYSHTGRLSRAFPGFLFVIMDQQSDWIDAKKLWTNYYVYRSVIDISIHESYDSPASTAKVTLSNFHNNLSKIIKSLSTRDILEDGVQKAIYELTGAIIDEKITTKMIELKNKLRDELYLYEGARIHIRMGYGSNLSKYPTTFNGTITNIEHGELITLIAQSEGMELANQPITDKSNQTNKDVDLPEETSNMVARMFTARENDFINGLTGGRFKINSKNGIEHFGTFFDGLDSEPSSDLYYDVNVFDQSQFDLIQNVYKGTYDGIPFATPSKFLNFDGEANWRFFASGKTVWDILKMCEKALPEFVAYPRYFGFENRFFFGVPSWLCNYKYEVEDSTGKLFVRSKAFSQVHAVSSLNAIIDNNIKIDTRGLYTNFIGSYTLGGDVATTPVIMSDYKIDWSRQKTKTIDTTSCWDFGLLPDIVEKFLDWSGSFDNGKELAIRVCVSELCISWKESYSGTLLVLGQPEISAYDYIYLDDNFLNMSGQISVREVVHSMSISSGFITSIVPGMIALNKIKQSGLSNVLRSTKVIGNTYAHYLGYRFLTAKMMKSIATIYSSSKLVAYIGGGAAKVANFSANAGRGIYNLAKDGKIVAKSAKVIKSLDLLVDGTKATKFFKIGKSTLTGIKAAATSNPLGWVAIASWIVVDFLIGWAINIVNDQFAYKKCILLDPLVLLMPDGTIKAYAGNVNGGENLLPIGDSTE